MVKKSVRELIFLILVFLLFYLSNKVLEFWLRKTNLNPDMALGVIGVLYTLMLLSIYYLSGLNRDNEGFWDVSPEARCKGGSYMWQGDDEHLKTCHQMNNTPDGRSAISSHNCSVGYVGKPTTPFEYPVLSNDQWENERCM